MNTETIFTVVVTLITVLGSSAAWKFYEKRLNYKLQEKKLEEIEDTMHITDLRKRIEKLEKLLEEASEEKNDLRNQIVKLTSETASMKTELEYLIKENNLLKDIVSKNSTKLFSKVGIKKSKKRG